jgi:hypothetical protein
MTTLQQFRCEVWGLVTTNPIHWFVIRCGDSNLTVYRWNSETVNAPGARHYCGEADAEVYISRWFDSVCAPPKQALPSALTVRHYWNAGLAFGMSTGLAACGRHSLECVNRPQRTHGLVGLWQRGIMVSEVTSRNQQEWRSSSRRTHAPWQN